MKSRGFKIVVVKNVFNDAIEKLNIIKAGYSVRTNVHCAAA